MVESLRTLMRLNRGPLIGAALVAAGGAAGFPLVLGLDPGVGLALAVLVGVATAFVYRTLSRRLRWDGRLARGRLILSALVGFLGVALLIQAVPYGWDRSNPPVTAEPSWDSVRTRDLAVRACFDCHSNQVVYPWYSRIAPVSWAVQLHVDAGREAVNYSEWDRPQDEADESAETVREGSMPPSYYSLVAHADARLSDTELRELAEGLAATIGSGEDDHDRDEDD